MMWTQTSLFFVVMTAALGVGAGVLAFVEFPSLGSDTLTFSRAKLPRL